MTYFKVKTQCFSPSLDLNIFLMALHAIGLSEKLMYTDCAWQIKKNAGTNFRYFRNVCSINTNGNYINLDTLEKEWHSS